MSQIDHESFKSERQKQIIGKMLAKHLTGKGEMWPLYTAVAAYVMNAFASSALSCFNYLNWFCI